MSHFGNTFRALRGGTTQAEIAQATGLSLRTIQRCEQGDDVALATIRTLADHFGVSRALRAQLLVNWIQIHLGEDTALVDIKPRGKVPPVTEHEKFLETFRAIPTRYQKELMRAAAREEVLKSIAPLNALYDSLKAPDGETAS